MSHPPNLAFQYFMAKPYLMVYLTSIDTFELVNLGHDELATLLVPLIISGVLRFFRFEDCLETPSANPRAARNVVCDAATYQPPTDPLTIGRFYQHLMLLDGYHRAAAFLKGGPQDGFLSAFVPNQPAMGAYNSA
jgi:hypothetical protein